MKLQTCHISYYYLLILIWIHNNLVKFKVFCQKFFSNLIWSFSRQCCIWFICFVVLPSFLSFFPRRKFLFSKRLINYLFLSEENILSTPSCSISGNQVYSFRLRLQTFQRNESSIKIKTCDKHTKMLKDRWRERLKNKTEIQKKKDKRVRDMFKGKGG